MAFVVDTDPVVTKSANLRYTYPVAGGADRTANLTSALYFNSSITSAVVASGIAGLTSLVGGYSSDTDTVTVRVNDRSDYIVNEE